MKRKFVPLPVILLMALAVIATAAAAQGSSRAGGSGKQRPADSLLVTPAWLARHLHDANLVLLHVGAKAAYDKAHIPGAQFISLNDISVSNSKLTVELPPVATLTSAFESRGISSDSRIVVYFGENPADTNSADRNVAISTRVIWTLSYYGLGDRVSLLDGGLPAWRRHGNPVTAAVTSPARGTLAPHLHPEFVADAAWVSSHLHRPGVSLIDARLAGFYAEGHLPGFAEGHIPGAENLPIERLVSQNGRLHGASARAGMFQRAGVEPGNQVVSYCYVGIRATLVWFVARMLGHRARVYDGSWQDWSARKGLPVARK